MKIRKNATTINAGITYRIGQDTPTKKGKEKERKFNIKN